MLMHHAQMTSPAICQPELHKVMEGACVFCTAKRFLRNDFYYKNYNQCNGAYHPVEFRATRESPNLKINMAKTLVKSKTYDPLCKF